MAVADGKMGDTNPLVPAPLHPGFSHKPKLYIVRVVLTIHNARIKSAAASGPQFLGPTVCQK